MEVNWTIITYLVVGYLAIAGFSRGWWKEAITTVFLTGLILFLQNPDWADQFIQTANNGISTIWNIIPTNVTPIISDSINMIFAVDTGPDQPFQFDASDPGTWLLILALAAGAAILLGRLSIGHQPTALGKILGAVVGGFNGLLILSLVREYLDGRALPGQAASTSELVLVGGSSFGPAASGVSIQATGLPDFTILDSVLPWIAVGVGAFFLISILRTRFGIAQSPDGRKLEVRVPPFYRKPSPPKDDKLTSLVKDLVKNFR